MGKKNPVPHSGAGEQNQGDQGCWRVQRQPTSEPSSSAFPPQNLPHQAQRSASTEQLHCKAQVPLAREQRVLEGRGTKDSPSEAASNADTSRCWFYCAKMKSSGATRHASCAVRSGDLLRMTQPQLFRDLSFSLSAGRVVLLHNPWVGQPGKIPI